MKLCFLANAGSVHTQRWATHFAQQGHDVTVLSLSKGQIPGVTVRCVGPEPSVFGRLAYLLAALPIRMAITALNPDVVHAHYAGGYGLLGAMSGWRPLIVSAWGSDVLLIPRAEPLMKWVIRRCLGQADLITSVAVHMSASIRALGVTGKIIELPYGADTTIFYPRQQNGAKSGATPLIVSTRNLEPVYNVGLLIQALPEIVATFPAASLVIVGDGSMRAELEHRSRELGVEKIVSFTGRLTQPEIATLLSKADIYVSTSLSDGNSISLSEAMACGAFPVVTDIPANREWIEHGRGGLLVGADDPGDLARQVIQGLRSPELRHRAAALNWDIVCQIGSWKQGMARMEAEYYALANMRGQRAQTGAA